jgi:hypothetical protein
LCRILRPERFQPENPPHLCEALTGDAIVLSIEFVEYVLQRKVL